MEGLVAAAGGDVSLHNFSARLWEQLVHFHVMRLTDSLFLWVGATPHLRNLAVAMCSRYASLGSTGRPTPPKPSRGMSSGTRGHQGLHRVGSCARVPSPSPCPAAPQLCPALVSRTPSPCLPPSLETLPTRPLLALPSA
ncbi:proteasome assembly chaperone 4 isoform X1 [Symphalangus syndactylus]|uniref:proteasome assembly chaperone 4 isoform X1 n=1 Tax=Symphalangus syndactylus TaxID=9590 RepID=UPI0030047442